MSGPSSDTIARAYAARDECILALRHLADAHNVIDALPHHPADDDADGEPALDAISDAQAAVQNQIDALDRWLNQHDAEAA